MGIPLFITPFGSDVASKAAEKTAARPRSSIRRLRAVGHPRMSPESHRRRLMGMMAGLERAEEYEVVEPDTPGGAPPRDGDDIIVPQETDHDFMRLDDDQLSFERRRTGAEGNDGPSLPPAPESEDFNFGSRFEALRMIHRSVARDREANQLQEVRRRQELRRMARRRTAPTPPYAEGDMSHNPRVNRPEGEERRSILTPARSFSRPEPEYEAIASGVFRPHDPVRVTLTTPSRIHSERMIERMAAVREAAADREALAERAAALTRGAENVLARQRARQVRLDGLGDRDRSLSPEGTTWDTLLSGITPDPQPPNAASSFASSAAAAASSSSGSAPASASTSMTSLDAPGAPNEYCEVSDSASATEDDDEEDEIYELRAHNRSNRNPASRSYVNALLADRAGRYSTSADTEHWEGMHHIISRLTERDDIPDSWWASAGLSRNLRREPST